MSAMMSDVLAGTIAPEHCNAVCNAGGKLLKVVEMKHKYGVRIAGGVVGKKILILAPQLV